MLNSFCDDNNLCPTVRHPLNMVDYTYNFSMTRFQILDHFLLSGVLFDTAINNVHVLYSVGGGRVVSALDL